MKYKKLVLNAHHPKGFWGLMMISSMNKGHYDLTSWGLSHVGIRPEDRILDVGCGGGKTIQRLARLTPGGRVYGVDISRLAVKKTIALNKKAVQRGKVKIVRASVARLPFWDDRLDLVTGIETFYFWPNPERNLREVLRVLKPSGKLLLVFEAMQDEENPQRWKEYEELIGLRVPSREGMEQLLRQAGFRDVFTSIHPNGWLCVLGQK